VEKNIGRNMRFFIVPIALMAVSCAVRESNSDSLVGTWRSADQYYLRIYPDGKVAQWPSPPEGEVSWSRYSDGELLWGQESTYQRNPRVERSGDDLVMKTSSGKMVLNLITPDLQPGQATTP
jgi:hypothetical protein